MHQGQREGGERSPKGGLGRLVDRKEETGCQIPSLAATGPTRCRSTGGRMDYTGRQGCYYDATDTLVETTDGKSRWSPTGG